MTAIASLRDALARRLGDRRKRALKSQISGARTWLIRSLLGYDGAALTAGLRKAGIDETDTLLVHANFSPDSGFRGAPLDLVNALVALVGERGNLLMVSIPFRGTAYDYLAQNKPFNVRKTISMMGLVTEMFRRREGTLRSLHPTHPVLAFGKDAPWLVADHERCVYPCGPGSPFEKFRTLRGKILFFDVSFGAITFFHHVEHLVQDRLPFPVYDERLFSVNAVDRNGANQVVQTYTFSRAVSRNAEALEAEMRRRRMIRRGRVGNSRFIWVTAEDVVSCFSAMVEAGNYPYDDPAHPRERAEP
jgi:aminoglycoside 3-N-acetyltransferase